MEKVTRIERSCLRTALGLYRRPDFKEHTDFKEQFSNLVLYDLANISRIDNFRIRLTSDHFSSLKKVPNSDVNNLMNMTKHNLKHNSTTGYLTPQTFIEFDRLGLIQNENNIPTLYHRAQHKANKQIELNLIANYRELKYPITIPTRDTNHFHRLNLKKYW